MKRLITLAVLAAICSTFTTGQNLAFIGEKSFPCTETFFLKSNAATDYIGDMKLVFAMDGEKGLLVVSSKLVSTVRISGKLIVYLDDGSVIICADKGIKDNMDDVAITAYYLNAADICKLEKSNINTVRYMVKCEDCLSNSIYEGNYTATNKKGSKTDFMSVATRFFNQTKEQPYKPHKQKEKEIEFSDLGSGFNLTGRSLVGSLPQPNYNIKEEGVVVVQVTVNKYGNVVSAEYQLKGSTTQNSTLKRAAIDAAKKARFNSDPNAPVFQKGLITYYFELN